MSSKDWIKQISRRIASKVKPEKIILFGSYAHGKPHEFSDIDLLVIIDKPISRNKRYELVDKAIGEHLMPVDLLVRNPGEIEKRVKMGDSFMMEILKRGKVLYES
ncbi:MAG: nucleotidyltransferase domain-containing protein [Elusimicrobia bacterium]|nr:nucleotidyltransferase domain-containing protein [Elusimicrobiota bacterium]